MARIKFGSIVTEGRGSLGGHTFQNSSGGVQLRTKPINNKKPSSAQSLIRSYNPHLQAGWRSLTDAQRDIWSRFATSHQICMLRDPDRPVCGHSLYMKYNFEYISRGLSLIASPYLMGPPYIGPEYILNGTFDGWPPWSPGTAWSILSNKAHYDASANSSVTEILMFSAGVSFLFSFDISDAPGSIYLRFLNSSSSNLFLAPYDSYFIVPNGHYEVVVTVNIDSNKILFRAVTSSCIFDIDNISLRRLYY